MTNTSKEKAQTFIPFVEELAKASGKVIRQYFREQYKVEWKSDLSPVTVADKEAESVMREMIQKTFPEHGILGEEFADIRPQAEYQWVLDPIDGTKSFISGVDLFGTLIALLHNGQPVLGAIVRPLSGDIMIGYEQGTFLNSRRVRVKTDVPLDKALLLATDIDDIKEFQSEQKFNLLRAKVRLFRTWGDCMGYFLLAQGFADIMVDPVMHKWDLMALIPIIHGAGGLISDYQGNDAVSGNSIIAASPLLHEQVLKILN